MRDVLLKGIADSDIRREALSFDGIQAKSIAKVIAFVESKEIARNANPSSSSMSAMSTYRKSGRSHHKEQTPNRGNSPL